MLFYYVQIKDRHDPDVNIREKANVIVERHSRLRLFLSRDFRGQNALRKLLGSIGDLVWLIIDLNTVKIIAL